MKFRYIEPQKIVDVLFDDSQYVVEFCEAGISSLNEFIENFSKHLLERNMENLRKAGHKIKPGAQMMGADEVIEEYEHAKQLLTEDADEDNLNASVEKMQSICTTVKEELNQLAQNQN